MVMSGHFREMRDFYNDRQLLYIKKLSRERFCDKILSI